MGRVQVTEPVTGVTVEVDEKAVQAKAWKKPEPPRRQRKIKREE